MLFFTFPAMVALLVPIILLEAFLCKRLLNVGWWASIKANAASNVASTVVGVPAAWGVMLILEFASAETLPRIPAVERNLEAWNSPLARVVATVFSAAWLAPDDKNLYWMVPLAALVLLVPTYFLSVWIESYIVEQLLFVSQEDQTAAEVRTRKAVRDANRISYGFLIIGGIGWLLISLLQGPPH